MPNTKKIELVKNLKKKVSKAKSIIITDYKGLGSNSFNEFRAKISENDAQVTVAKNTLLKVALKEEKKDVKELFEYLKGSTAVIFSYGDIIAPIKTIVEFAKKMEFPKIKAAIIEGKLILADEAEMLSKLPGRQQLLTYVVRGFKSPIAGFVNVVGGSRKKLVYTLSAIAKKKEVL